ncbi:MAG TPA: virulence-associated E family protein [Polyangiaceae bacterium]|nr:virulence-associated E family protein [Polyangiaceae bacterium]
MTDNVRPISSAKPRKPKGEQREPTGDWHDALVYSREGTIEATVANVITIFANDVDWCDVFVWDEFGQTISTARVPPWDLNDAPAAPHAGEWSDSDTVRAQAWLARHYALKVGRECVYDAVRVLAEKIIVNPPRDWLEGLRWDGVRRVDGWLAKYLGAKPSDYVTSVGRWMFISAVARIFKPGCKVDTMLVLEGPQGLKKSTTMRTIFSDKWFSDTPLDLNSKDRFVGLRHNWCHEFAELDALGKAEVARVKSFLSSQSDDFRPPYGKSNVKVERRCIFVGTVNDSEYLRDATGNRRFWPVRCGKIDIAALSADREQLMAEAREMFLSGARWWPEGTEVSDCEAAQAERTTADAWTPLVSAYLQKQCLTLTGSAFVTIGDILTNALGIEKAKWGQSEQNRVAKCLLQLGWRLVQRREGGNRVRGYVPPENVTGVTGASRVESEQPVTGDSK